MHGHGKRRLDHKSNIAWSDPVSTDIISSEPSLVTDSLDHGVPRSDTVRLAMTNHSTLSSDENEVS